MATPPSTVSHLEVRVFKNRAAALGLAVEYLMTKPAFGQQSFGHWSRILTGQIRRGHYMFVVEGNNIRGFAGWARVTKEQGEAWVTGKVLEADTSGTEGDFAVLNAWAADNDAVNKLLVRAARAKAGEEGVNMLYAKREYDDGRMRPLRLPIFHGKPPSMPAAG